MTESLLILCIFAFVSLELKSVFLGWGSELNEGSTASGESEQQTTTTRKVSLADSNPRCLKTACPPGRPDKAFCPEPWAAGVCLRGKQMVTNSGWCFHIQYEAARRGAATHAVTRCCKNVDIYMLLHVALMFNMSPLPCEPRQHNTNWWISWVGSAIEINLFYRNHTKLERPATESPLSKLTKQTNKKQVELVWRVFSGTGETIKCDPGSQVIEGL